MSKSPDFTTMAYDVDFPKPSFAEWQAAVEASTGKSLDQLVSATMELINVKPLYTQEDIKELKHLGYTAGVPPFLRGPYPTMYVAQPWTVRMTASDWPAAACVEIWRARRWCWSIRATQRQP